MYHTLILWLTSHGSQFLPLFYQGFELKTLASKGEFGREQIHVEIADLSSSNKMGCGLNLLFFSVAHIR